jgi:hypothetical protein
MTYLILRSTSMRLEPSFHTTLDRLTKLASKMIYLKSGISQHCLKQRLNADNHCRRQITLVQRLHLLSLHKKAMEEGLSFTCAAESIDVGKSSLLRWHQELVVRDPTTTLASSRSEIVRNGPGPTSILADIKHDLILFITEWRDRGMPVSRWTVVKKAGELKPEFLDQSYHARAIAVS